MKLGRGLMTTYYAAFLRPGTLWDPEKTVREQLFWDDHARYMDVLFETGVIILGGPFADRTGSLVIVAADNAAQVRELYRRDPWTEHDVLVVTDVKEWTIFLDARRRQ
jgi:uncharacterized protein YciI